MPLSHALVPGACEFGSSAEKRDIRLALGRGVFNLPPSFVISVSFPFYPFNKFRKEAILAVFVCFVFSFLWSRRLQTFSIGAA